VSTDHANGENNIGRDSAKNNVIFIILVPMYYICGACHEEVVKAFLIRNETVEDRYVSFHLTQVFGCCACLKERPMKTYRKELWFEVPARKAFINITPKVEECLRESGIREGLVLINAMHITASVFINDDESGLHHDFDVWLEKLAPHQPISQYRHNVGEDNADAHLKRQIMGREVVVAITEGKLDFGPWEQIFYGEFDGRRRKRVLVKVIGE